MGCATDLAQMVPLLEKRTVKSPLEQPGGLHNALKVVPTGNHRKSDAVSMIHPLPVPMETPETAFVLPQDVPPLLQDAVDSLYRIIGTASRVRRNTQKIFHFIARCIGIIKNLTASTKEEPSTFGEMIAVIESAQELHM